MPADTPVATAAAEWIALYVRRRTGAATIRNRTQRVRDYLVPFLGTKPVGEVTRRDLMSYAAWLSEKPLSPRTQAHILADCRCFFRWLEDEGSIAAAPIPRRFLPKVPERAPHPFTDDEVARLRALPDPHGFVIRLALATGMRWGELARAETRAIENGCFVIERAKSGRVRRVPIAEWFVPELVGRVGLLVPCRSLSAFNRRVKKLAQIPGFHVHRLRHTFACQWLRYGGSLAALKEILGHQSVSTTEFYSKLGEDLVAREASRVWKGHDR